MSTGKGYFDHLIQVSTMTTDTEGYRNHLENLFGREFLWYYED